MLGLAIPVYGIVAKEIRLGGSFGGISLWDLRLRALTGNPLSELRVTVLEAQPGDLSLGKTVWGIYN